VPLLVMVTICAALAVPTALVKFKGPVVERLMPGVPVLVLVLELLLPPPHAVKPSTPARTTAARIQLAIGRLRNFIAPPPA
jgi:hypothetical protein